MFRTGMLRTGIYCLCLLWISNVPQHSLAGADAFDPERLEKRVVVAACHDPLQLEFLSAERLVFIERHGDVKLIEISAGGQVKTIGQIPVAMYGEVGLLGIARDRFFAETGWLYMLFCPREAPDTMRLSRFTLRDDRIDLASQVALLEYSIESAGAIHMGGGLYMDQRGNLHIGTGDNCPPIPELPVDQRPGRENFDALRTSANSMDLRGKVLRIHPEPDGSYSIPSGNLFSEQAEGRAEIYAMGCRNPFRVSVDEKNGCVYWGDVGPNIELSLKLGPNGYDEINRAAEPGNFGWPMFVGPNEAYRDFDFTNRQVGETFDTLAPVNDSKNNTGLRILPKPRAAMIWYPSAESSEFPTLGSGGRSAMAGPVYHFSRYQHSPTALPDAFDGSLFIYEWTRNWIRTVEMDDRGKPSKIVPFMPGTIFRKPIDMKIAPDGTLYIIEYGDKWGDNRDSQITQVVYRRGNREPLARLVATPLAGRHPLNVQFDASGSSDPDNDDRLAFQWTLDGVPQTDWRGPNATATFSQSGIHRVAVTAIDLAGERSTTSTEIRVGNAAPEIVLQPPQHGSFFDWGDTIRYRIRVNDYEDGSTDDGTIASGRVLFSPQYLKRRAGANSVDSADPGLTLMRNTTCFSCHTTKSASAGPAYREVARKHAGNSLAREQLAEKIMRGGAGVWGSKPMPPHPQHSMQQTRLMADWILSLANDDSSAPVPGSHGFFRTAPPVALPDAGVLILHAEYTDQGTEEAPAIRTAAECVLHTRRKRASGFDMREGIELVDVFERQVGLVAKFRVGDWIAFRDVCLKGIDRITWYAAAPRDATAVLTLRADSPTGPELSRLEFIGQRDPLGELFFNLSTSVQELVGVHDLYIVAESIKADDLLEVMPAPSSAASDEKPSGAADSAAHISLSWVEFHDSPATLQRKRAEEQQRKKIVLVPTKLDHPWGTHMYANVCQILAACLNQTPGVEAIVSPDYDWPRDPQLLAEADAIVFYSRPAGDILLSAQHRQAAQAMLKRGVGFTAIHWATGAEGNLGEEYKEILGGWFNFDHSGLKVDQQSLSQLQPEHPICRGWNDFLSRDEFYLNLKFSERAKPLLQVDLDGQNQTVAWVHDRRDGGRSFGTTLGHFYQNYTDPKFRRLLVQGILWTAEVEIPEAGVPVEVAEDLLRLETPQIAQNRDWTWEQARAEVQRSVKAQRAPSFSAGEQIFQRAACANCHAIGTLQGSDIDRDSEKTMGKLGPNLTQVRQRFALENDPAAALLRSIIEPSHTISAGFQTEVFVLADGSVLSGVVREEIADQVTIISNPDKPKEARTISRTEIEDRQKSSISMMPAGLLNRLAGDEIYELYNYVQAGGNAADFVYQRAPLMLEPWADQRLPVQAGLQWWLDASRLAQARQTQELSEATDGNLLAIWHDASGRQRHVQQRQQNAQPRLGVTRRGRYVEFDGVDDFMLASNQALQTEALTLFVVVAPNHNQNWPGIISGNTLGANDYQSGFNLDLMPTPTTRFESLMVEGKGYPGVTNLMTESHDFGQFLIVTVRSQPGSNGVQVRINGRPQLARDRPAGMKRIDELAVAARYWSNDAQVPPFNRGFLSGRISQVLLYDRPLEDDELIANEVFLWESNRSLLDPLVEIQDLGATSK
ncbi:PQQ-dependent sugar dehydrogenase [Planctomycetaceae bacterium SH139]